MVTKDDKMARGHTQRLIVMIALLMLALVPADAVASQVGTSRRFGIGIGLGSPTGLSMKYFMAPRHALEWGFGVAFFYAPAFSAHMDYKAHLAMLHARPFDLGFYLGVGVKFMTWFNDERHRYWGGDYRITRYGVGVRVPIGIAFQFNAAPFDLFVEVAPGLGFYPGIGAFLDGSIGFRYYF